MTNRLAGATSPYLRQHQDNPVDWYPWGADAFEEARRRDVPILLSIGYASCHWCHVMAHESFSDPDTADVMNRHFVNIKVDREERPDVDAIYIQALQAMNHQTGWPLNVFVTPDGLPFFGGTYFPKTAHPSLPAFRQVLLVMANEWQHNRENLLAGGEQVRDWLQHQANGVPPEGAVSPSSIDAAIRTIGSQFDREHGGFGSAPKFPQPSSLAFLLAAGSVLGHAEARSMAETTLDAIADGGIHDQLGGGFSRYSVDAEWHVPHFEKMLYDNAQLLTCYVELWKATHDDRYRDIATSIVTWAQREMLLDSGAFASALDADTNGVEGATYVWTAAEIDAALKPEAADLVKQHFGVADPGPFEGKNVLRVVKSAEEIAETVDAPIDRIRSSLTEAKARLLDVRSRRPQPGRDEKAIASWNGLMIRALVNGGMAFGQPRWVDLARRCAETVLTNMLDANGRLARSWNDGRTSGDGQLDDYANIARAAIELYAATGERPWLDRAMSFAEHAMTSFRHDSGIGFYDAPADASHLIVRPRDLMDSVSPSGNATMAEVTMMLSLYTRRDDLWETGAAIVRSMARPMADYPLFFGQHLTNALRLVSSRDELIFTGQSGSAELADLRHAAWKTPAPLLVVGYAGQDEGAYPMLEAKPEEPTPAAYLCESFTCRPPVTDAVALIELLETRQA